MKILLTGSSGQIGTNLALKLIQQGHQVQGIDKRKNTWTDKIPTIILDLSHRFTSFEKGFGDHHVPFTPDLVVHFAANAKVHELVKHPDRAMDNIVDTFNVLEYCRRHKLPIIFSSSREVYGDIKRFVTDEKQADFLYTESPYSASKIAGEALIYSYAKCYGIPYIVLRFSNVYGRYDNDIDRMERVIPLFIKRIDAGEPIVVFGKDKVLDFTYVDDCTQGVMLAIQKLHEGKVKNEIFNLAFGQGHSLLNMVGFISESLGKNANMTVKETQLGEVRQYIADISKAKTLLGYNPTTSLKEGIKKTVDWWKETNALSTKR